MSQGLDISAYRARPEVIHETPARDDDPLRAGPRATAAQLREQELVHAYGAACCAMVEWIRHSGADAATKHAALMRIADVAAVHYERHRREAGL